MTPRAARRARCRNGGMAFRAAPRARLVAYADLVLAMITVGSIVPASKVMAGALPPFLAGAVRLAVAAAVLVPWSAARGGAALVARSDLHDRALLAVQAAAGTVGFTVLLLLGTARASAADASVVAGTLPLVAVALSALALRERPGRRQVVAAGLAVAALAIVGAGGAGPGAAGGGRLAGLALVLGAVTCESLFILLQKRLRRPLPPLAQSAAMAALGLGLVAAPAALEARALELRAVPLRAWVAAAYYGLVPTVGGFYLWYRGAARVSAAEAGVCTAVMPLAGAALSWAALGEPLGPRHAAALGLVAAAVALSAAGGRPASAAAPSTSGAPSARCQPSGSPSATAPRVTATAVSSSGMVATTAMGTRGRSQ